MRLCINDNMSIYNNGTIPLGKTKVDQTKRISLIKNVAEIFDAIPGDEIEYYLKRITIDTVDGEHEELMLCIKKVTKPFKGWNFEEKEIDERMRAILPKWDSRNESTDDYESDFAKAQEEYEKYKEEKHKNV